MVTPELLDQFVGRLREVDAYFADLEASVPTGPPGR
jgi:hypothetical protein